MTPGAQTLHFGASRVMAMRILQSTPEPCLGRGTRIRACSRWFTWSSRMRQFVHDWQSALASLREPELVHLGDGGDYDATYTGNIDSIPTGCLSEGLMSVAEAFSRLEPPTGIALLTGLLDDGFDISGLHSLLAYLRGALVRLAGDPWATLYPPLGTTGSRAGRFPLHADLYRSTMLMNIFNEVAADRSGRSVFLSVESFVEAMSETPSLPPGVRDEIPALLTGGSDRDNYTSFFALVHGRDKPWSVELDRRMRKRQVRIRLNAGEGYLIHDRRWLHGREAPRGGVPAQRLHRLVFDTIDAPADSDR
jgi:hypothetical protein